MKSVIIEIDNVRLLYAWYTIYIGRRPYLFWTLINFQLKLYPFNFINSCLFIGQIFISYADDIKTSIYINYQISIFVGQCFQKQIFC